MHQSVKYYLILIFFVFTIILGLVIDKPIPSNKAQFFEPPFSLQKGVMVLELMTPIYYNAQGGILGSAMGVKSLIDTIESARENPNVQGLILRVNSPGGTFGASEELFLAMERFAESGKPIVSSIIDICASGAYYAVLPSKVIIANRGAIIGSIGVRITSPDLTDLYKKIGLSYNQITSAKYKDILSESRKMTSEEQTHLKKMVDTSHRIFVSDVIKWREEKSSSKTLEAAANGLIYSTEEARELGLIDEVGDLEKAKKVMAGLLDKEKSEIEFFENQEDLMNQLFRNFSTQIRTLFQSWFIRPLGIDLRFD